MAGQITIRGRTFSVESVEVRGVTQYALKGARGASYATLRNSTKPSNLFLIDRRGFGIPATMQGVWLSDEDGTLKVVRQ